FLPPAGKGRGPFAIPLLGVVLVGWGWFVVRGFEGLRRGELMPVRAAGF
ncbi:hypothetical protein J2X73_004815, partial [Novosphingobium sp. 1748]|nr:hypothetical protein [Novosphingobium sp. 1748]